MEEVYRRVDELLKDGKIEAVGDYLNEVLDQCRNTDDYGRYLSVGSELMNYYVQTGNYEKAHVAAEDLLLLLEELQQENSEHFARILMNSASVYAQESQADLACEYYERAIRILRPLADIQPVLAQCASAYGMIRMQTNQQEQAGILFLEAIDAFTYMEEHYPEELSGTALSMLYAASYAGLGEATLQKGDLNQAADYYVRGAKVAFLHCHSKETAVMLLENAKKLRIQAEESSNDPQIQALEQMFDT